MFLRKAFKYRIRLSKKQARLLRAILDECRWLYNQMLEYRKLAYEELDIKLTKYDLLMLLPAMKIDRPSLNIVHSQVLQDVVIRLDRAFEGFFRRVQAGEKPGYPRFRGIHRYDSFTFPQSGFSLQNQKTLKLSKIGDVAIKLHRPIEGEIKTCTLICDVNGNWNVSFSCEVSEKPLLKTDSSVGIDVGITHFASLSDGTHIENPRFFKQEEKALAKAQRKLSTLEKGTSKRRKQGKAVAKIHTRIRNKRQNFAHQVSRKIVNENQYICVEDLNIKKMVEKSHLSKSITDASWNQFLRFLSYKAVEAGRKLGLVNPAYTTQMCSSCGHCVAKKLSERQHICVQCGYTVDRDFNASQNILALGLDGLGVIPRSLRL
jgi:putative transposase